MLGYDLLLDDSTVLCPFPGCHLALKLSVGVLGSLCSCVQVSPGPLHTNKGGLALLPTSRTDVFHSRSPCSSSCVGGCVHSALEVIIHDVSRKQCIYWAVRSVEAYTINPINPAMLGNGRLAVRVQIDFTEHRQKHGHLLSPQPSSNMTHRFEEHGNTGNL